MRPSTCILVASLAAGSLCSQAHLFTFPGAETHDRAGSSVAVLGDLDLDGCADVAVGAPGHSKNGTNAGRVYVYSGKTGKVLFTLDGQQASDEFGWSVAGAGDVDKDGWSDFIVGAPFADDNGVNSGRATVYSGKTGLVLHTFRGANSNDVCGISVAGAGDVDKDGYADLIVGEHGEDTNGAEAGRARVFSGKTGLALHTLLGDGARDFFGHSVAGVGDVDQDGHADLAVGAPDDDNNGSESGMVRVFSGRDGSTLFTWNGDAAEDFLGHYVAAAGDVDKDGWPDVIAGAPEIFTTTPGPGYARVWSGKTGAVLYTFRGDTNGDFFGEPVTGGGDLDGDGWPDLLVGAHLDDTAATDAGMARAYSGKDGSVLFTLRGKSSGDFLGYHLGLGGDVNGWKSDDLIVGAPGALVGSDRLGLGRVLSGRSLPYTTDTHSVSLAKSGKQTMTLVAGPAQGTRLYTVLGSMTGTTPVEVSPGIHLPLEFDTYMVLTFTMYNTIIQGSLGWLDTAGESTATFQVTPKLPPALIGTVLHHAFCVFDLSQLKVSFASNPAPLTIVQ